MRWIQVPSTQQPPLASLNLHTHLQNRAGAGWHTNPHSSDRRLLPLPNSMKAPHYRLPKHAPRSRRLLPLHFHYLSPSPCFLAMARPAQSTSFPFLTRVTCLLVHVESSMIQFGRLFG